jgi:hypothetical protein
VLVHVFQSLCRERKTAFEDVQHDPLEEISEREVSELGEGFQDLEQPFFHPHAGLDTFNDVTRGAHWPGRSPATGRLLFCYHGAI